MKQVQSLSTVVAVTIFLITQYTFMSNSLGPCDRYLLTVTPFSEAGAGNSSEVISEGISDGESAMPMCRYVACHCPFQVHVKVTRQAWPYENKKKSRKNLLEIVWGGGGGGGVTCLP